jgi:hypothetical protein
VRWVLSRANQENAPPRSLCYETCHTCRMTTGSCPTVSMGSHMRRRACTLIVNKMFYTVMHSLGLEMLCQGTVGEVLFEENYYEYRELGVRCSVSPTAISRDKGACDDLWGKAKLLVVGDYVWMVPTFVDEKGS